LRSFTIDDYKSYAVSAATGAGKVYVKDASHPTSVTVNQEFSWYLVGEVRDGTVRNPAIGYYYYNGPADRIRLVKNDGSAVDLPKGYAAVLLKKGDQPVGTTIDSRDVFRGAVYPAAGTYTIYLCAGALSDDEAAASVASVMDLYEHVTSHVSSLTGLPLSIQASPLLSALRVAAPAGFGAVLLLLTMLAR
jgi:hypothetical protein